MFTNIALVGDGFLNTVPVIIITCLAIWLKKTNYFRNNKNTNISIIKIKQRKSAFFVEREKLSSHFLA